MLTQTGGQCRASSYLSLAKKALISAGFSDVPVLSLSANPAASLIPGAYIDKKKLAKQLGMGLLVTDALAKMYLATAAREAHPCEAKATHKKCLAMMEKGIEKADFKYLLNTLREAISEFNALAVTNKHVPVLGVLGEIFVKYNSFSNNNIVEWLLGQGVEVVVPSLTGFFAQRFVNEKFNQKASLKCSVTARLLTNALDRYTRYYLAQMEKVMQDFRYYRKPRDLKGLAKEASNVTSLANQAGEGWLLPAEMIAMLEDGISNIVCLQPFGCLANHITGSGVERRLKRVYPQLNLLSLNMDPGASEVNILNRLHFMVMAAREEMNSTSERTLPSLYSSSYEPRIPAGDISVLRGYMSSEIRKWRSRVSGFVMR